MNEPIDGWAKRLTKVAEPYNNITDPVSSNDFEMIELTVELVKQYRELMYFFTFYEVMNLWGNFSENEYCAGFMIPCDGLIEQCFGLKVEVEDDRTDRKTS